MLICANAVAEHMVTSHKVAIKIINKGRIKSLDMMDKVKQTLQCAACMFFQSCTQSFAIWAAVVTVAANAQVRREIHILSMCRHPHVSVCIKTLLPVSRTLC
jgi:hypothetical protein